MLEKLLNQPKDFLNKHREKLKDIAETTGTGIAIGLVVLLAAVLISRTLYHEKRLVKRGFEIALKVPGAPEPKIEKIDFATLMANADVAAGAKVFKKCASCHSEKQGGGNKVGPNLFGIVGRKVGTAAGFSYSPAITSKGGNWTVENLDKWLAKPKDYIPGTKMGFAGLKKDKDRANVIAYLKNQK